jgi:isocitrate lyase
MQKDKEIEEVIETMLNKISEEELPKSKYPDYKLIEEFYPVVRKTLQDNILNRYDNSEYWNWDRAKDTIQNLIADFLHKK